MPKGTVLSIRSLFLLVILFGLGLLPANAQRYRDRGDQSQRQDDRKAEDSPDSLENKGFVNRLVYGSTISVAGDLSSIEVSPILGYKLTPQLQAGIGVTYIYWNYFNPFIGGRIVGSIYGGRVYAEYDVLHDLLSQNDKAFVHGEYETLNVPFVTSSGVAGRTNIYDPYLGIGYRQPLGRKAYILYSLLYNVQFAQYQDLNPYGTPLQIRLGITF